MEATPTAAVSSSAALSEGSRRTNQPNRCKKCKQDFGEGGSSHFDYLHRTTEDDLGGRGFVLLSLVRDSSGPLWASARPMPNLPLPQRVGNQPIPMQLRVGHPALCVFLIPSSLVVLAQSGGFQPPAFEH